MATRQLWKEIFMIYQVYTLQDIVAGVYLDPFLARSDEQAIRLLIQQIKRNNMDPNDLRLWNIASFDIETGVLIAEKRENVALKEEEE